MDSAFEPDDLARRVAALEAEILRRDALIAELGAANAVQAERIAELERRLGLNSSNSGKPPSSDGLSKPTADESRKRKRGTRNRDPSRKPGGQKGHKGSTLARSEDPDVVVDHYPETCSGCGEALDPGASTGSASRQVHDVPEPLPLEVTEHRAHRCQCPACGAETRADFPEGVTAWVRYGPRITAMAAYLSAVQLVPLQRLRAAMADLFGVRISQGTLAAMVARGAARLSGLALHIRDEVARAGVKHMDETGIRVRGRLAWLHVACTRLLSHFRLGAGRGDVMADATGIAVHDCWKPYFRIPGTTPALCAAHVLRELQAVAGSDGEKWAERMARHLQRTIHAVNLAGGGKLRQPLSDLIGRRYDSLVAEGVAFHESLAPLVSAGTRGQKRRRPGHNLALRLRDRRDAMLRFTRNPAVPATNNEAERALRPMKVQQKISGSFRSEAGARNHAVLRTVLDTARRQGWNLLQTLQASPDDLMGRIVTSQPAQGP